MNGDGMTINSNRILGYDILKILASFFVVMSHFWDWNSNDTFDYAIASIRGCAVCTFMALAFFFSARWIFDSDINKLFNRLKRLLLPFWFWGLFCFIILNGLYYFIEGSFRFGLIELLQQLIFGDSGINNILWYLFDLMVLNILAWILLKRIKKTTSCLLAIGIISYFFVLLGINSFLYEQWIGLVGIGTMAVARLLEMIPYVAMGLLFARLSITEKYKCLSTAIKCIVLSCLFFGSVILRFLDRYWNIKTFGYGYPYQLIVVALLLMLFYFQDDKFEKYKIFRRTISFVSSYSMGIYCSHLLVGNMLKKILELKSISLIGTIWFCLLVWLASFAFVVVISFCPKLKMVSQ